MIIQPNILIVGSTGRNIGKTEFACRVIKKNAAHNTIIGIKVVPVDKCETNCHRGIDTCGLCDSLTGEYNIIEESTADESKDTTRMFLSGAKKVYLLIVDRQELEVGVKAILNLIPKDAFVIIESNTLRKVIEPGLFIVIKKKSDTHPKPTCAEVIDFADKIIEFDEMSWNFNPENVCIQNNQWVIKD